MLTEIYRSHNATFKDDKSQLLPRHSQIVQQYSSSTDEGCETDHGEMDDAPAPQQLTGNGCVAAIVGDGGPGSTVATAAVTAMAAGGNNGSGGCVTSTSLPTPSMQRLNSYASSSSSSGVVTNFHSKSLSQNLSCESSRSNFSTLESLDLNLSDCSDLAGSLPSCASSSAQTTIDTTVMDGKW